MRFFHKFESINYKYFALINGILLNTKKKTNFSNVIKYLAKYSYVFDDLKLIEPSNLYTNKIWQLWFQGEDNMPAIVKKCTESVKKFHEQDVIMLNSDNLVDYVEIPDYIERLYQKGRMCHANYSDIVRLILLAKYGGTWVDSTIMLTDRIPDDIRNSEIFMFRSFDSECLHNIKSVEQFAIISNFLNKVISIESPYFIHAKSGSRLINAILQLILEFWKNEQKPVDYLMIDKFFALAVIKDEKCREEFMNMPIYYLENVLLLQEALFEKFDTKLFENIKLMSPVHKLTYKNLHRNPYKDSFLKVLLKEEM